MIHKLMKFDQNQLKDIAEDYLYQEFKVRVYTKKDEEGRSSNGFPGPKPVTKEGREDNARIHTPFEAWCKYCVRGRGKSTSHMKNKRNHEEIKVLSVSMDFCFMNEQDEKASAPP